MINIFLIVLFYVLHNRYEWVRPKMAFGKFSLYIFFPFVALGQTAATYYDFVFNNFYILAFSIDFSISVQSYLIIWVLIKGLIYRKQKSTSPDSSEDSESADGQIYKMLNNYNSLLNLVYGKNEVGNPKDLRKLIFMGIAWWFVVGMTFASITERILPWLSYISR